MIAWVPKWILVFYSVALQPDGSETIQHTIEQTGYETLAKCNESGEGKLALIDAAPGTNPYFVCVPIEAIKNELIKEIQPQSYSKAQ